MNKDKLGQITIAAEALSTALDDIDGTVAEDLGYELIKLQGESKEKHLLRFLGAFLINQHGIKWNSKDGGAF